MDSIGLAPAVAEIRLDALRHNLREVRSRAGGREIWAVVKANAYGHGTQGVVPALLAEGCDHYAVATLGEAVALRALAPRASILVFASFLPGSLPVYAAHGLSATVATKDHAADIVRSADRSAPIHVHVKVDTGMGRIGLTPADAVAAIRRLDGAPGVTLEGIWTHLATGDDPDRSFVDVQADRFADFLRLLGSPPAPVHLANSGALFLHRDAVDAVITGGVRSGIALYGIPEPAEASAVLTPVMRLTAPVTQLKTVDKGTPISYGCTWAAPSETRIATVAIGYADGYRRAFSNRAHAGFAGRQLPVAGRVCMDMTMFDAGPSGSGRAPAVGERVVLMGGEGPTAHDLAGWAETITYEITCGISPRVERRYE